MNVAPIEDLRKPIFAVATDFSTHSQRVIREGPLWQAIRASCAIPGVLPPFIDGEGHMLVDGGLVDNVPYAVMKTLKSGPTADLRPQRRKVYDFAYESRRALARRWPTPWIRRPSPPKCPGPPGVILRSIFGQFNASAEPTRPHGLVLTPPPFRGSSFMDWSHYMDVLTASYEWALREIDRRLAENDPALKAMIATSAS